MESLTTIGLGYILENADKSATLAINSLSSPFSDSIWMFFSEKVVWVPLYLAVAIFFYIRLGWKKATIMLIAAILTIVACDQFANWTKDFFSRLRPCFDNYMISNGLVMLEEAHPNYQFGFYSAHAANAMGFAAISFFSFRLDKRHNYRFYGAAIFTWAVLVGLSRIFVGKHFLGDVLVGLAIGYLFAYIIYRIALIIPPLRH